MEKDIGEQNNKFALRNNVQKDIENVGEKLLNLKELLERKIADLQKVDEEVLEALHLRIKPQLNELARKLEKFGLSTRTKQLCDVPNC